MERFDPELAEIRFGCGLSPVVAPPKDEQAMLNGLTGPDTMVAEFPIEPFEVFLKRMEAIRVLWKDRRSIRGTPEGDKRRKEINLLKKDARQGKARWLGQTLLRRAYTPTGFRERLIYFWGDHFTAYGKAGLVKRATSPYIEDAIRPRLTGRFADLLVECVRHPVMLHFLDQHNAMGPNSIRAQKRGRAVGLNENLAREVLELHTLGVDGPYTQTDVRELAELFTGMSFQANKGFKFRKDFAEPGAETILGVAYDEKPSFAAIRTALEDLAAHPATARHIAWKLAVHFTSDTPDPDLVSHLEDTFLRTDGDLMALYAALLEHPAAWALESQNAKWPVDFVGSALRALAVDPTRVQALDEKGTRRAFMRPMADMGQVWQVPNGPDGWAEEDDTWFTPQGLSARIRWAMAAPEELLGELPDPRTFVDTALGSRAPDVVRFAAGAAESKSEAIALVLSSPAFQKR